MDPVASDSAVLTGFLASGGALGMSEMLSRPRETGSFTFVEFFYRMSHPADRLRGRIGIACWTKVTVTWEKNKTGRAATWRL